MREVPKRRVGATRTIQILLEKEYVTRFKRVLTLRSQVMMLVKEYVSNEIQQFLEVFTVPELSLPILENVTTLGTV